MSVAELMALLNVMPPAAFGLPVMIEVDGESYEVGAVYRDNIAGEQSTRAAFFLSKDAMTCPGEPDWPSGCDPLEPL